MKILFLTPCVGAHEAKFVKSLSQSGHETRVFSFHYNHIHEELRSLPHVSYDYVHLRTAGKLQRFLPFHFLPRLKRTIREFRPDILHAGNTWNDSMLGSLSGFHPLLVMPYGSDVLLDSSRSFVFRAFNKIAFAGADWVTCDAEHVKKKIMQDFNYPSDRITVIPWGIDVGNIARLKTQRDEIRRELGWQDKFVVISTRNHEPVYGIDVFLRAVRDAIQENNAIRVILIGSGSLHEESREFIRKHNLDTYFDVRGKTPLERVLQLLQASDLYVSSSYSDGTSVSLMEAMASSLAVLLTDVPSNLEWITSGKNGEVVARGDHIALGRKLVDLSRNPSMVKDYGRKNLERVSARGDWNANFQQLESIYRDLAQ